MTTDARDRSFLRLYERTQRLFGRIDDVPALLDLVAQTLVSSLEELDPAHRRAPHLLGAAGLIARSPGVGVFRPLKLAGRPDPQELSSFVEHVGPGESQQPVGLMGWSAAERKVALRRGDAWQVAERDDERDRWASLRAASEEERGAMRAAAIAAYRSIRAQLVVPILDPEIRGEAQPRRAIGIVSIESDALFQDSASRLMIAFAGALGHPVMAALRLRDVRRLAERLALVRTRTTIARNLLAATLPYLAARGRRGFVALRDRRSQDEFVIEALTGTGLDPEDLEAYRARRLRLAGHEGIWGQAVRTCRTQYLPDAPRRPRDLQRTFWRDSRCLLVVPLLSGDRRECLGLLGLESSASSFAFSAQDRSFFETAAALAAVAAAGLREPFLAYPEAVRTTALLQRAKCDDVRAVPDDQIVRINAICRALIKRRFSFRDAAAETRLSVHILREYTSRSPRVIDVEALRAAAIREAEMVRIASQPEAWEAHEVV